jgi:NADPH:quinone reductase-like Zn-dependent oxidoreductase
VEAAGLSLAGLTAYRAVFTKGQVTKGQNVLITGIGGGAALFALQYAAAVGANVYVTSSSESKIERARQYGAKGGVNYNHGKDTRILDGNVHRSSYIRDDPNTYSHVLHLM